MSVEISKQWRLFAEQILDFFRKISRKKSGKSGFPIFWYVFQDFLRSHGNSRGVNSREVRGFFGHSSESTGWILTKFGGN